MEIKSTSKAVSLLYRVLGNRDPEKEIACIPYYPQKPEFAGIAPIEQAFPRAIPESQGVESERIADFLEDVLENQQILRTHQIMILRNGKVITECAFYPHERGIWHITHSLCKSITSLAIGLLIDEGKLSLDTRILDIYPDDMSSIAAIRKKELTIRHLLTMSSGISLNEAGSVTETEWLRSCLESKANFKAGSEFHYNSMNTYVLSEIVKTVSGKSLAEYLSERLFEPMSIRQFGWEKSPAGLEKGGWGLYILAEDVAKLVQLTMDGGKWNGEQLISADYIRQATTKQIDSSKHMSDFGYGFQIWMGKRLGSYQFNGMLGQNAFAFPDLNMQIVVFAGNGELFPKSLMSDIVSKYFGDGFRPKAVRKDDPEEYDRLQSIIRRIETPAFSKQPLPREAHLLDGINYRMYTKNTLFLPLILQCMQNNHSKGITDIAFTVRDGVFRLNIKEHDISYSIPVGFGEYLESTVDSHGEKYLIKAAGVFTTDEDDNPVFKVHIPFIETANARFVKFFFLNNGRKLKAVWSETPDMETVSGLDKFIMSGSGGIVNSILQKATDVDSEVLKFMIQRSISPIGFGEREDSLPAEFFPQKLLTF